MPVTRSTLELLFSPVEMASGELRRIAVDLTTYLQGGTINSQAVRVMGGPAESEANWTDVTSTVQTIAPSLSGNILTIPLSAVTPGYRYRVIVTWNSAASAPYQTLERFFVVECVY